MASISELEKQVFSLCNLVAQQYPESSEKSSNENSFILRPSVSLAHPKIANSITDLIGRTPLLRLGKLNPGNAEILLKLESMEPCNSVKVVALCSRSFGHS